jgi:DNA polymerase I-like protein with 3'-5' exonuclease and polymerase domains
VDKALNILTIDFETYYAVDFSLTKLTTEEYVRDDLFEVVGVSVKENDGEPQWFSGTKQETKEWLNQFDWDNSFALAHNAMFDSAILSWTFGMKPRAWFDTLSMARASDGLEAGNSLAKLAQRYNLGVKGTEVVDAKGLRRADFNPNQLGKYGEYCKNDVVLTYDLFQTLLPRFSLHELKLIDLTLRMFYDPVLFLDTPLLEQHLMQVKARKDKLLAACVADKDTLMSNPKLADLLINLGVEPPMKESPANGKQTYAFAKNDEGFKELAEHPDERVQAIVAARLGTKSTLEETRTERFISISKRGRMPVPLRYYAAHTGRWGGDDKLNLQNLPRKSLLKEAIVAPDGYVLIDADSSQIEARTVAWLSGQNDLVSAFEEKQDVYKIMASSIYGKAQSEITDSERFVGKTTILGAGYGMGATKFGIQLKTFGVEIDDAESTRIIQVYRDTYPYIPKLWKEANSSLDALRTKKTAQVGCQTQALTLTENGFLLPSGLYLNYPDLQKDEDEQYSYASRRGRIKIYGGKVIENVCQALARCIIGEQMLRIAKRYRVALTVHDAVMAVVPEGQEKEALLYINECMRWRPSWATTLPLACELGMGKSYGDCSKKQSIEKWNV